MSVSSAFWFVSGELANERASSGNRENFYHFHLNYPRENAPLLRRCDPTPDAALTNSSLQLFPPIAYHCKVSTHGWRGDFRHSKAISVCMYVQCRLACSSTLLLALYTTQSNFQRCVFCKYAEQQNKYRSLRNAATTVIELARSNRYHRDSIAVVVISSKKSFTGISRHGVVAATIDIFPSDTWARFPYSVAG